MAAYKTDAIRQLLVAAFNDIEFDTFCFDNFREVYNNFTGMSRAHKIQSLIEHCDRHGKLNKLVVLVKEKNSYQYDQFSSRIGEISSDPETSFTILTAQPQTQIDHRQVEYPATSELDTSSIIVHRKEEWELIKSEISTRHKKPAFLKSVIVLYGTAGIGKTTFIKYTLLPWIRDTFPALHTAYIDFDKDKMDAHYDLLHGRGQVVIDLLRQLAKNSHPSLLASFTEATLKWERAAKVIAWGIRGVKTKQQNLYHAEEDLVEVFHQYITSLTDEAKYRPVVIILDTVEQADDRLIDWIQESLQLSTTDKGYTLWIMAGRQRVDSQLYSLRPRYHQHLLQPFNEQQIKEQLPKKHAHFASIFRQYTGGLPEAVQRLDSFVQTIEQREEKQVEPADLEEYTDEVITSLESLLKLNRYLSEPESDVRMALQILSPLRVFDVTLVCKLLPDVLPEKFQWTNVDADKAAGLVERMAHNGLASWNLARRGFVIEQPVRQIIALIFRQKEISDYLVIHRWAVDYYRAAAGKAMEKRLDYIMEVLYHELMLCELEKVSTPVKHLTNSLKQFVQDYYSRDDEQTREILEVLKRQLQNDPDFQEIPSLELVQI